MFPLISDAGLLPGNGDMSPRFNESQFGIPEFEIFVLVPNKDQDPLAI
jgi:hypothetical protein